MFERHMAMMVGKGNLNSEVTNAIIYKQKKEYSMKRLVLKEFIPVVLPKELDFVLVCFEPNGRDNVRAAVYTNDEAFRCSMRDIRYGAGLAISIEEHIKMIGEILEVDTTGIAEKMADQQSHTNVALAGYGNYPSDSMSVAKRLEKALDIELTYNECGISSFYLLASEDKLSDIGIAIWE